MGILSYCYHFYPVQLLLWSVHHPCYYHNQHQLSFRQSHYSYRYPSPFYRPYGVPFQVHHQRMPLHTHKVPLKTHSTSGWGYNIHSTHHHPGFQMTRWHSYPNRQSAPGEIFGFGAKNIHGAEHHKAFDNQGSSSFHYRGFTGSSMGVFDHFDHPITHQNKFYNTSYTGSNSYVHISRRFGLAAGGDSTQYHGDIQTAPRSFSGKHSHTSFNPYPSERCFSSFSSLKMHPKKQKL